MKCQNTGLCFLLTMLIFFCGGQTKANHIVVSGTLGNNTTWNVDTVRVQGDIFIPDSVRLTIRAGTLVEFWGTHKINVNGSVRANGKANDSIRFLPGNGNAYWNGFHMDSTAMDSSVFQYCRFALAGNTRTPYSEARGGAFALNEVRWMRISHCLFETCYSGREGGAIWAYNSSPEISYNQLRNNRSQGGGGCIMVESSNLSKLTGSNPFIHHNIFTDNQGGGGGAIYCKDNANRFLINDNLIVDNLSDSRGGGISLLSSDNILQRNIIRKNVSEGYSGGAIFLGDSRALVEENIIDSNLAYSRQFLSTGGGIAIEFSYGVQIINNLISDNKTKYGGAVSIKRGSLTLSKNRILRNDAQANGSALYCEAGLGGTVSAYVDSNEILDNANVAFACIYGNSGTTLKVVDNYLENNGGGGLWSQDRKSHFSSNTIVASADYGIKCINFIVENNSIQNCGTYGIIVEENAEIKNNLISGNDWGGLYVDGHSPRIEENSFHFNGDSTHMGGGLELIECNSLIVNNSFRNNLASSGGAVYCSKGKPVFSSNLFSNNSAVNFGGAFYFENDTTKPLFINSTVVNNEAGTKGGGVYSKAQNWISHYNDIYYGNKASISGDQYFVFYDNYDPNFYFSDVEGTYKSFDLNFGSFSGQYVNNLDTNPNFRQAASSVGHLSDTSLMADWRLAIGSPLVNKGDTSVYYLPKLDLAKDNRVQGDSIDIGAYELNPPLSGVISLPVGKKACEGSSIALFSQVNKVAANYQWHLNGVPINGAIMPTYTIVAMSYADTGSYYCVFSKGAESDTSNSDVLGMYLNPNPGTLGPDTSICRQTEYTLRTKSPFAYYNWNNGLGTADTFRVLSSGNYFLEVKDSNLCAGFTDTVSIQIYQAPPLSLGNDTTLCKGDSLFLQVSSGFQSYNWSDMFVGASRWLKNTGLYQVTTSDTNMCSYTDSIKVEFNNQLVSGIIWNQRSDPLPAALVELLSFNPLDTSMVVEDSVRTDSAGFYAMPNVKGGKYLRVSAENHVPQYALNVPVVQQADTVAIVFCDTSFYDFTMQYDIYSALIGSIGGHISNLNTLLPISPVRETRVLLVRGGTPWRMQKTKNGYFHFQDLNAGIYELWIDRMFIDNTKAPKINLNSGTHHTDSLAFQLLPDRLLLLGNLGINKPLEDQLKIIQADDFVSISSTELDLEEVSLFNLQGKLVVSKNYNRRVKAVEIDVQSFAEGIYLLLIQTENGRIAKRIILH